MRRFAARVVEELGYRVLDVGGADEALALAATFPDPIDLLVTDVTMSGLQGHQLAERLAAQRPGLRVLSISGFTENSVVDRGTLGAGRVFLVKPFSRDALARAVRRAIEGT
ncbi:MAG: hypothetical protein KatS3mg065_0718 [Chloroflexota bacterium]|nr:MAG: hypothetical protein KatS3mg065_0718 [Chloroflexota bacterium]